MPGRKYAVDDELVGRVIRVDEAAERIGTTADVLHVLMDSRQIRFAQGANRTTRRLFDEDVQVLSGPEGDWIRNLSPRPIGGGRSPSETRLSIVDVAAWFGVPVEEARVILGAGGDTWRISRWQLWLAIVAGMDVEFGALKEIEERLARARQSRSRPVSRHVKQVVRARDGDICRYCGRRLRPETTHFDHVVPRSAGGTYVPDNIVQCCIACNVYKRNRQPHEAGMTILPVGIVKHGRPRRLRAVPLEPPPEGYAALVVGEVGG